MNALTFETPVDVLWPDLARRAGLTPGEFSPGREWVRTDAGRQAHIRVYSSAKGPKVIVKQIRRPLKSDGFITAVRAQDIAAFRMGSGLNQVPQILAIDEPTQAMVMEHAPGQELYQLIESATDHTPLLRRAGQWLAAYHRCGYVEKRSFSAGFSQKQISGLAASVASGATAVFDAPNFEKQAGLVVQAIADMPADKSVIAAVHGDMNLKNLMKDGDYIWGLDFNRIHEASVAYDVARLLLHYGALLSDHSQLEPGLPMPRSAIAAFFDGYDILPFEDASIQTILRVKVLNEWAAFPAKLNDMSVLERFRCTRLRVMLESMLDT